MILLPSIVTLLESDRQAAARQSIFRFQMRGFLNWIERHRTSVATICSIVGLSALAIACWPGGSALKPETDLTVMHPRPNPALDAEAEFSRLFGIAPGWMLIHLQADSSHELVRLAYEVQRRLASEPVQNAGVVQGPSLASWLPDPDVVTQRHAAASQQADRVVDDFKTELVRNGFKTASFDPYADLLHKLVDPGPAPTMATLLQYPALWRDLLPKNPGSDPTEAVTIVLLNHRTEDRAARDAAVVAIRQALDGLPGAMLSGLPVVGYDAESAIWRELDRVFIAAAALVGGYLILHFRGIRSMLLSVLPALFGLAGLAAIVRLADIRLNMVNIVAIPLLIGIDVDYGIYLVTLARRRGRTWESTREALHSAAHAVLVCSTSMIVGYASLIWTSVPAVRSLGEVVAIGVALCVSAAYFLLCPLLSDAAR
jgi:predicted RND superfamily exporter protein